MDQQFLYQIDWTSGALVSAVKVWVVSIVILSCVIPWRVSALIAFFKVAIIMAYFCWFADGTWFYGGDDYRYYELGMEFLATGANPITIFLEPVTKWYFFAQTGYAFQIFYNYLALYFLEPRYYSAVLGLVVINSLTVALLVKSFRPSGRGEIYQSAFAIFLLLHWYTIAWTSFLDIKDPLVGLAMAFGIYLLSRFRSNPLVYGSAFLALMYSFHWLRFYFPAFFAASFLLSNVFLASMKIRLAFIAIALPVVVFLFWSHLSLALKMSELHNLLYGLAHFLLQPAPWRITEPASYLLIPSVLHWLMAVPTFLGAVLIYNEKNEEGIEIGKLLLSVFLVGVLFYAAVPAIASTRHRAPLDLLMAVMQFHFCWWVFEYWMKRIRVGIKGIQSSR